MSDLIFEKLQQSLSVNQSVRIDMAGNLFRVSASAWPVTVSLIKQGRILGKMNALQAGDYVEGQEFDGIIIDNGGIAQDVTIQIAGGGAGSDRVLGEVSVINGEIQRVRSNSCFIGVAGILGAAGQFAHTELWNPAGSGKNLILSKLSILSAGVTSLGVDRIATALATLVNNGASKKINTGFSAGELRVGNYAGQQGVQIANLGIPLANQSIDFPFSEPLMIGPGAGICVWNPLSNTNTWTTFQWYEEPI